MPTCAEHGLHYDPATATGCVLCRRSARPPRPSRPPRPPRWRVAALLVLAAAIAAFAIVHLGLWRTDGSMEGAFRVKNADGRTGAYYIPAHEPAHPLPLLVALHGTGGNGRAMVEAFRELADERRFAIAAPDSRKSPNGQWTWEVGDHPGEVTDDYRHVMDCIAELRELPNLDIDAAHVLIAGHSGGASSAPYIASNESQFTAFAVLHGGVFPGGFGGHRVPGWLSTGKADTLRPPDGVRSAADSIRLAGFRDIEFHLYDGGHDLAREERHDLVVWWLR